MSDKLNKALATALLAVSEVAGGVMYTEDKIAEVIRHTEIVVQEAQKPKLTDGMSEPAWKLYASQSNELKEKINNPIVLNKATPEQAARLDYLFKELKSPLIPSDMSSSPSFKTPKGFKLPDFSKKEE